MAPVALPLALGAASIAGGVYSARQQRKAVEAQSNVAREQANYQKEIADNSLQLEQQKLDAQNKALEEQRLQQERLEAEKLKQKRQEAYNPAGLRRMQSFSGNGMDSLSLNGLGSLLGLQN